MEPLSSLTLADLLDRLASKIPAPGGGAAAGLVGAHAAALARMVVSYSLGRKSLAAHQEELASLGAQLDKGRGVMLALADEDAEAYEALSGLWPLPADDPRRQREFQGVVRRAIMVPRAVVAAAADLLRACERLLPISNPNLRSDLIAAAVLAEAAGIAAGLNVRVNAPHLADEAERARVLADLDAVLNDTAGRRARVATDPRV